MDKLNATQEEWKLRAMGTTHEELFIFGGLGELLIIPCYHYTISPQIPRPTNKISFFIISIPFLTVIIKTWVLS